MSDVMAISEDGDQRRVYVRGSISKEILAAQLDAGYVCTDFVPRGHRGGDVAYFRKGGEAEIAECRETLRRASIPEGGSDG